ncbi:MAG: TlpA disulfide reductase family protein [Candidatus Pseudobacter hemicellulosilyticus]|uniref:TlpA disulfide reductase family protein n=1 Tax=Candidatus Pseudobacter hemicellulosilyticus TaxID=3121375 RepID=A0AAJ5WXI3_9BACT|nr:MAG: TlpA disulfide reductase family protein [Pseudobacter sp.]
MFKIIVILSYLLAVSVFGIYGQGYEFGFKITGSVEGVKTGSTIFLMDTKNDTICSTKAVDSHFEMLGRLPFEGEMLLLGIVTESGIKKIVPVFVENDKIDIVCDFGSSGNDAVKIIGSSTHNEYVQVVNEESAILEGVKNRFLNESNATGKKIVISEYAESQIRELQGYRIMWILNHPDSYLSPWLLLRYFSESKELFRYFNALSRKALSGKYGKDLKSKMDTERLLAVGSVMPDFELTSVDGNLVKLSKLVGSYNFTIIDFWASWCGPCRSEFPEMKKNFSLFREKGVMVIGYSVDKMETSWRSTVLKESLPWINVIDTNDGANMKYNVEKLPTYFLLDSEGRIVNRFNDNKAIWDFVKESL